MPPIKIVGFELFNQLLLPGMPGSPLEKTISEADYLTLDYTQSVFSFRYAALNYINSKNNQYAYRLEGFDEAWLYVGNKRTATYINLGTGHYHFHMIGANNDGVWNRTGRSIYIVVTPPPWLTWWAYCIYIAIAFCIISFYL